MLANATVRDDMLKLAAVLTVGVAFFVWSSLSFYPYIVDDAFISFRYSQNLVDGAGLVYNAGERVEGYSNFSWVLACAALLALDLPLVAGAKCLGLASGVAALIGTVVLGRRVFAGTPGAELKLALATALLAFNAALATWSQAGLETVFFAALLVLACARFERELARPDALPLSSLLFALAWLTRPEAPVYLLYFVVRRWSARSALPLGRRDLAWLALTALVLVPYEVWGLWYYGTLLPNTHAAKLGTGAPKFWRSIERGGLADSMILRFALEQGWAFAGLLTLGAAGCVRGWRRVPTAAWAPVAGGLLFAVYAWNDWMPRFRLFVPLLPFLFLGLAHGLGELYAAARQGRALRAIVGLGLLLLVTGYAYHEVSAGYGEERSSHGLAGQPRGAWFTDVPARVGRVQFPLEETAWYLLRTAPEGETVAIADIGFPGFLAPNPIWDVRGLVTPAAARTRHDRGAEASAARLDAFLDARPAFALLPTRGASMAPYLLRFDEDLRADERVRELYERSRGAQGVVHYRRRDLEPFDAGTRVRAALERFGEYDSPRARAARRRLADGAPR